MALGKKELIAPNFKGTNKGLYSKLSESEDQTRIIANEELLYE